MGAWLDKGNNFKRAWLDEGRRYEGGHGNVGVSGQKTALCRGRNQQSRVATPPT